MFLTLKKTDHSYYFLLSLIESPFAKACCFQPQLSVVVTTVSVVVGKFDEVWVSLSLVTDRLGRWGVTHWLPGSHSPTHVLCRRSLSHRPEPHWSSQPARECKHNTVRICHTFISILDTASKYVSIFHQNKPRLSPNVRIVVVIHFT